MNGTQRPAGQDTGWIKTIGLNLMTDRDGTGFAIENQDFVTSASEAFILALRAQAGQPNTRDMVRHVRRDPAGLFQYLIDQGTLILLVRLEGEWSIFCRDERNSLADLAKRMFTTPGFRMFPDTQVAWSPRLDGNPRLTTAGYVLRGKGRRVDNPPAAPEAPEPLSPTQQHDVRHRFWSSGGANPEGTPGKWSTPHAQEIVNKLLR
jgi:hypothetical protein